MSYNINLQHIVFRTKHSEQTIPQDKRPQILAYINSVSNDMGVKIMRLNAHLNHVHILADVPVTMPLSEYVRKIKQTTSAVFQHHRDFPLFQGWATGYGSFSVSHYEREHIINYIKGQDEHHRIKTFEEEMEGMFGETLVKSDAFWRKNWVD